MQPFLNNCKLYYYMRILSEVYQMKVKYLIPDGMKFSELLRFYLCQAPIPSESLRDGAEMLPLWSYMNSCPVRDNTQVTLILQAT